MRTYMSNVKASFGLDTYLTKPKTKPKTKHGITPRGHRLLVLPDEVEEKTASGIVVSVGTSKSREELAQVDGVVVAMGNTCYSDQPEPWCAVGDKVIFGKYSGIVRDGKDGLRYRVINDLDVVATLDKE
jgi:co-chaperonin GroES (HSP10)